MFYFISGIVLTGIYGGLIVSDWRARRRRSAYLRQRRYM